MSLVLLLISYFYCLSLILISDKHLNQKVYIQGLLQNKKRGAYICLFDNLAYHSHQENKQRNIHVGVYQHRKVCLRDPKASQHTTESIHHSVAITQHCFCT